MYLPIAVDNPSWVESSGRHSGHEWVVTVNPGGFRCGYIKVEPGHPWHGKGYDDVEADCHGGLTYAEPDEPCDAPGKDNGWWFGFDCIHGGDGRDLDLMDEDNRKFYDKTRREHPDFVYFREPVRSREYVENECRSLCKQAATEVSK